MNKKLSGAKAVIVPITKVGKNYLPFIEDLRNRYIKYIDAVETTYLPETTMSGVTDFTNCYITIADKVGNMAVMRDLPLNRLNYQKTYGVRQPIAREMSMQNSYIEVTQQSLVGKGVLLVFWYDLPEYSQRNVTDETVIDGLSVPITTAVYKNQLPDSLTMAGKRFRSILFQPVGVTPDYQTGVNYTDAHYLYLTLRKGSYNVLENVPVALLYQLWQVDKIQFANMVFDFQSSYIIIGGQGTYTAPVGKAVYLNFVYEK